MRRLSQVLVLELLSASTLLYQFLQPAIGGKGQFLKVSCHSEGLDRAALKGILWDSAAINSRGSEIPTGPRKYDVELASVRIRSSVESSCLEKAEEKFEVKIEKIMPNEAYGDEIYLGSLILARH
jgi:hypothetical protein